MTQPTEEIIGTNTDSSGVGIPLIFLLPMAWPIGPAPTNVDSDYNTTFVNAKQYHRILKRRTARDKLIREGKIPAQRQMYLHESRHLHAMQRRREKGGRFYSKATVTVDLNKPEVKSESERAIQSIQDVYGDWELEGDSTTTSRNYCGSAFEPASRTNNTGRTEIFPF